MKSPEAPWPTNGFNAHGDTDWYTPTVVDATHITLNRPYDGDPTCTPCTGRGWLMTDSNLNKDTGFGWGSYPYMMGLMGMGLDFASRALASSDQANSAVARTYNISASNWISKYGIQASTKGLYYEAQFVNCQQPIQQNTPCDAYNEPADSARSLSSEAIRGMSLTYEANGDPALKANIDTLYNALWAKPGTCPSGSIVCVPDGIYLDGMDDGGFYISGAPPIGTAPKWFGQFFGITALATWPAIRLGGPLPLQLETIYIADNLSAVPGSTALQVTTTAPNGQVAVTTCSSTPCAVQIDSRLGNHLIQPSFVSSSGKVVASSQIPIIVSR
jgi:hypothetical protein